MTDRYDGDIALAITPDGGNIDYAVGQPRMDAGGLENAVTISLFTQKGWHGNALDENQPARQIGSDFEITILAQPITPQKLRDVKQAAEDALQWMIDIDAVESVAVVVTSPELNAVNVEISIAKPASSVTVILYELNWIAGRLYPVNATVK